MSAQGTWLYFTHRVILSTELPTSMRFINPTEVSSGNRTIFYAKLCWIVHITALQFPPHYRETLDAIHLKSWDCIPHPQNLDFDFHSMFQKYFLWLNFHYLICQKYGIITAQENSTCSSNFPWLHNICRHHLKNCHRCKIQLYSTSIHIPDKSVSKGIH